VESFTGFPPAALTFLRGLARNNRREWFEPRREVYEQSVRRPLQLLVEEVDARLGALAPEITGNPRRSVFRIHRDVRFSKDKSPYKTQAACWFYHRDIGHGVGGRTHGGAGLYFQVAPGRGESIIAAGIWMPATETLAQLRAAILDDHETLDAILCAPTLRRTFGTLSDEAMLVRTPRGVAADHPAAALLRYRSFTVSAPVTPAELASARLPDILAKRYAIALPLVRWLNAALGLPAHTRR